MRLPAALRSATLAAWVLLLPTCGAEPKPVPKLGSSAFHARTDRVVLLALDGVRWQDVVYGPDARLTGAYAAGRLAGGSARELLPHLTSLAAAGVLLGADAEHPMVASGPDYVSLPGYVELCEGRGPTECAANSCRGATQPTLFDALAAVAPASDVAAFTSWAPIERALSSSQDPRFVVSAGRERVSRACRVGFGAELWSTWERGQQAEAYPGTDDFRPDRFTARLALDYLEKRRPRLTFIGLGEPDEYAHRGDYASYWRALEVADSIVGEVLAWARRVRHDGERVTIWVTADHGRAHDFVGHGAEAPESARVWAIAAGSGVARHRGKVRSPRTRRLADISPTLRYLLGLPVSGGAASGSPLIEVLDEASSSGQR